jgi:hypothetical protein
MDVGYKTHLYERQMGSDERSHEQEVDVFMIYAIFIASRLWTELLLYENFLDLALQRRRYGGFIATIGVWLRPWACRFSGRYESRYQDDAPPGTPYTLG